MRHGRAVMPWGKYKGVRIRLLPDDYLSWLTTIDLMKAGQWKWLKDSLVAELEFRGLAVEYVDTKDPVIEIPDESRPMRKFRFDEGS